MQRLDKRVVFMAVTLAALMLTAACSVKRPTGAKAEQCGIEEVDESLVAAAMAVANAEALEAEQLEGARMRRLQAQQAFRTAMQRFESEMIHFNYDSAVILPKWQEELRKKAAFLKEYPDLNIEVSGFCDERGSIEYNLALGERRALAAKNFLVHLGIDQARVTAVSFGKEDPLDRARTETAWAKNRRDEFRVQ